MSCIWLRVNYYVIIYDEKKKKSINIWLINYFHPRNRKPIDLWLVDDWLHRICRQPDQAIFLVFCSLQFHHRWIDNQSVTVSVMEHLAYQLKWHCKRFTLILTEINLLKKRLKNCIIIQASASNWEIQMCRQFLAPSWNCFVESVLTPFQSNVFGKRLMSRVVMWQMMLKKRESDWFLSWNLNGDHLKMADKSGDQRFKVFLFESWRKWNVFYLGADQIASRNLYAFPAIFLLIRFRLKTLNKQ